MILHFFSITSVQLSCKRVFVMLIVIFQFELGKLRDGNIAFETLLKNKLSIPEHKRDPTPPFYTDSIKKNNALCICREIKAILNSAALNSLFRRQCVMKKPVNVEKSVLNLTNEVYERGKI